ncbi:GtrA family protein [Actinoplanes sp. RD1]|uniref:GtrA family protein n=1 Tax=Actinoplanes sp. RD1 TaxID=3064538 RepID=UPI002741FC31|nr:GtrA family protein [Actinoplanes sp. RD1]
MPSRSEVVGDLLTSWVDKLPARVRRVVTRDMAGFAELGAFTFAVDLALLAMLRAWTPLPLPVAVSIAYVVAFALNFVLNRTVNFRSHAPAGPQAARYAVVIAGDYLITVGASTALAAAGLPFAVARVAASGIVAVFTYSASRWWVFRDRRPAPPAPTAPQPTAPQPTAPPPSAPPPSAPPPSAPPPSAPAIARSTELSTTATQPAE